MPKKTKSQVTLEEISAKLDLILKQLSVMDAQFEGLHGHLDAHMDEVDELFEHLLEHVKSPDSLEKVKKKMENIKSNVDKKPYIS